LIVPTNPGGNYDNFARCIAANAGPYFGVPIIIKNVPGGMFTIGMKEVVESAPDGYTLEASSESANIYGTKFVDAGFQVGDVQFIAGMTAIRHTFCVNANLPYQDIEELLAYVKEHPGEVTMGTSSPIYECWLLALRDDGYEFTQVPFPTGTATSTAVAGGHVDCAIVGLAGAKPLHEAGAIRILFVGDNLSEIPGAHNIKDYPWIEEALQGVNVGTAMVTGPKGIPEDRLAFIEDALHKTWEDPAFQSMALQLGLDPIWYGTEDVNEKMQEVDTVVSALTEKYNVERAAQQ
jgi:tripartite-type tricarboxylate transporter receptor subunit TctC